jgi:hypothetical protein
MSKIETKVVKENTKRGKINLVRILIILEIAFLVLTVPYLYSQNNGVILGEQKTPTEEQGSEVVQKSLAMINSQTRVSGLSNKPKVNSYYINPKEALGITPTPKPEVKSKFAQNVTTKAVVSVNTSAAKPRVQIIAPADIDEMVGRYSQEYGLDKNILISIIKCESGFNAGAVNGPYGGLFQFLASTWSSNRKAMGLDPDPSLRFDAEEAIRTAAYKMGRDGFGAWPACSRKALAAYSTN